MFFSPSLLGSKQARRMIPTAACAAAGGADPHSRGKNRGRGPGLQLRLPGDTSCLQYAASQPLSHDMCRVTNSQQRWLFESSTMRFRHSELNQNCLQFDEATTDFMALACSTDPAQKFHASLGTDGRKYCIGHDEHKCVQEATLGAPLPRARPLLPPSRWFA